MVPDGKRTRTVQVAPGIVDALIAPQLELVIVTKSEVGGALGLGAGGAVGGADPSGFRSDRDRGGIGGNRRRTQPRARVLGAGEARSHKTSRRSSQHSTRLRVRISADVGVATESSLTGSAITPRTPAYDAQRDRSSDLASCASRGRRAACS